MKAIVTADIAQRAGVVVITPPADALHLFRFGRVIVEPARGKDDHPDGLLPDVAQPLAEMPVLASFFAAPAVLAACGGITALQKRLEFAGGGCQWPHGGYHHHELTTCRRAAGAVRLCWSCDNRLRDQHTPELDDIAARNSAAWIVDYARSALRFNKQHVLTLPELCWWAVVAGVAGALPEGAARAALNMPPEIVEKGPFKEVDIKWTPAAAELLRDKVEKVTSAAQPAVITLAVDDEAPEQFMRVPKLRRVECEKYTRWVKTQSCCGCGAGADDPHHIIGNGQGGTGTKTHDLLTLPLCRMCHNSLHKDPAAWESEHGTQAELFVKFFSRAVGLGVIAIAQRSSTK